MRIVLVASATALAVLVSVHLSALGAGAGGPLAATPLSTGKPGALPIFRVRDTGIRCVRAPCFFMRARRLSTGKVVAVSELDLRAAGLTPVQAAKAASALQKGGLVVAGRIVRAADGGRSLRASAVYLNR
jgi:hypothetical protein